jgi:hypothetical protein
MGGICSSDTSDAELTQYCCCVHDLYEAGSDPGKFKDNPGMVMASQLKEWDGELPDFSELVYQQRKEFQLFRAFWGKGVVPSLEKQDIQERLKSMAGTKLVCGTGDKEPLTSSKLSRDQDSSCRCCQDADCRCLCSCSPEVLCCCTAPSWWQDFVYYSANNHPVHGIFSCSPAHRLSRRERICMEVAAICFCFLTTLLRHNWVDDDKAPHEILTHKYAFSLFVVTIPSMIVFKIHWILFTFPCGVPHPDRHQVIKSCAYLMSAFSDLIGYLFTLAFIGAMGYAAYYMTTLGNESYVTMELDANITMVVLSRVQSYVIYWLLMLGIYFNPWLAWGEPDPKVPKGCISDIVGLGQWQIEKLRFQNKCVDTLIELVAKSERGEVTEEERRPPHQLSMCCPGMAI